MKINAFFIGSEGGVMGPINQVLGLKGIELTTFDARTNLCFWSKSERRPFYLCRNPCSCSLLPPEPSALEWIMPNGKSWLTDVGVIGMEMMNTITLDEYCLQVGLWPHILGMDIQGVEWEVLSGSPRVLQTLLAVITEIVHHPIYHEQRLFGDMKDLLEAVGFRFIDMFDKQVWCLPQGKQEIVGKAVFLKKPERVNNEEASQMLAAIESCYRTGP